MLCLIKKGEVFMNKGEFRLFVNMPFDQANFVEIKP